MTATLLIDDVPVADLVVADTFGSRLRGMLARRELPDALLLVPCRSVHGLGMTQALDVAFCAPDGQVLAVSVLRPMGLANAPRGTSQVLESPRGRFERWGLAPGRRVTFR